MDAILFDSPAALAISFLNEKFQSHGLSVGHVGTNFPADPLPDRFIVITRTGGLRRNLVLEDGVLFSEVYGASEWDTDEFTRLVVAWLTSMDGATVDGVFITGASLVGGITDFFDDVRDRPRHQFTFQLTTKFIGVV